MKFSYCLYDMLSFFFEVGWENVRCSFEFHKVSSGEVRVLCVSESRSSSHSVSMVQISSSLLSVYSCPMVSSPTSEGKSHPFGPD